METLKLSIPRPVIMEIAGAAGNTYRLRDWFPVALVTAVSELIEQEQGLREATGDWDDAVARWDAYIARARELAVVAIAHGGETPRPGLTWDDIAADFPDDAPAQLLGFIWRRWFERANAADPERIKMLATVGRAIQEARATGATQTPTPMSRAARRRKGAASAG